ncbi:MAG TPA: YegP family protein [Candidatus Elarobacter sp.]|nr:YegP family protein [Candidatus Elarobacter sp.]
MPGSFEIKKSANGKYHFNLKAGNGEIILTSEMYEAKGSAESGIASVQTNSPKDERYARSVASNGKFYFTLKAANHQVIGNSQMYETEASRDGGILSVKANGATTVVKDNT